MYCPVSGVFFEVRHDSPSVDVDGQPVYACCEGCAHYLRNDLERVLRLRGIEAATGARPS